MGFRLDLDGRLNTYFFLSMAEKYCILNYSIIVLKQETVKNKEERLRCFWTVGSIWEKSKTTAA